MNVFQSAVQTRKSNSPPLKSKSPKSPKSKSKSPKSPKSKSKSPKSPKSKSKSPKSPNAMYPRTSFTIQGQILHYFTTPRGRYDDSAILTYFGLDESNIFERIFRPLIEMQKNTPSCEEGNRCGPNASKICNRIRQIQWFFARVGFGVIENGIYFISPDEKNDFTYLRKILESHYGSIGNQTTSHYHAIPYIIFSFENHVFYVAMEPTFSVPYKMQFLVALSEERLLELLKLRYHYEKIAKSSECSNDWMMVYRG